MPRRVESKNWIERWGAVLWGFSVPVVSSLIYVVLNSFNAGRMSADIATKPDLAKILESSNKYTDEKADQLRKEAAGLYKEAIEHSDANRQGVTIDFEKAKSDITSKLSLIEGQLNLLIQARTPTSRDHR